MHDYHSAVGDDARDRPKKQTVPATKPKKK